MTSITADEVRQLIARIKAIAAEATDRKTTEESLAARVEALVAGAANELPLTSAGDIDDAQWELLAVAEQRQRHIQLLRFHDALTVLTATDGPTNPSSIMFRDYVSNRGVIGLTLFALLGTLLMLFTIHYCWPGATESHIDLLKQQQGQSTATGNPDTVQQGPREADVLLMVMLMGSLGGFIHMTGSLSKYIGNRQLLRSWIIYYCLMPVEGAGLAVTVYLMVRVGVLNPASINAGNATQSLNWVGIYALSTLAGLFSKQALELLSDLFNTIFRRVQAKDAAGGSGPPANEPAQTK